jgi:hypothetical protein
VVEAVPQTLTAAISYKDIPFIIKHLVLQELGRKHAVMIHYYFSLAHDNGALLITFNVQLESFLLKLLNHGDISVLKVPDAQLEHLQLLSEPF